MMKINYITLYFFDFSSNLQEFYRKQKIFKTTRKEFFNFNFPNFKIFYEKIDIFCLPTYVDSFGYALLEAMSIGLPLVATNIFAIPEIIEDGKNGFLINTPLSDFRNYVPSFFDRELIKRKRIKMVINELVEKLSILIENSSLRRRMGKYGRQLVERGKFSIKERNEKLRRIYEESIKK